MRKGMKRARQGTESTSGASPGSWANLTERLRERRGEIEEATLTRAYAISDPAEVEDPSYVAGLREAVAVGLDYGLAALESPRGRGARAAPVPVQLLFQARYAARLGISLDTVLRRYFAGYTVLGDFIVQEAKEAGVVSTHQLQWALREEAALFDRLVASISEEYRREAEGRYRSTEENRAAHVRMLLGGELVDAHELDYELTFWHVGAIAVGSGAQAGLRELAGALDRRLLSIQSGDGAIWAWLGGGCRLASHEVLRQAESCWPETATLALGEPGEGIEGWRLTHRQAKAAISVALRRPNPVARYAEVALLASALTDEVLARSLEDSYLAPLRLERDDGAAFRETLRAYFSAERNVTAAAASLGVSRPTVQSRLRAIEERIGRPLGSCAAELETVLELHELARATGPNLQN
jgi:PucR C-terminal helix-turn-helix domain/GGDEF-like domain